MAKFGRWTVLDRGRRVLRGDERLELRKDIRPPSATARAAQRPAVGGPADERDSELLEALKDLRRTIAKRIRQPAYVVFSDRTLAEMATVRPTALEEMHHIYGVGEVKLEKYGALFLQIIARYSQAVRPA